MMSIVFRPTPEQAEWPARAPRYELSPTQGLVKVQIYIGRVFQCNATLINISPSGLAVQARSKLQLGASYELHIDLLGCYRAQTVRRFGTLCYGARFLMDATGQDRLRRRLDALSDRSAEAQPCRSDLICSPQP